MNLYHSASPRLSRMPLPKLLRRLWGGEVTTAVTQRAAGPAVAAQVAGGVGV